MNAVDPAPAPLQKAKIKLVVIEEHTLGYVNEETPQSAGILCASTINRVLQGKAKTGSPYNPLDGSISIVGKSVRMATVQDFIDFNVSHTGYTNDWVVEYIFAKNPDPTVIERYDAANW